MNCIRCTASLKKDRLHDIEVDNCPEGHGMWLDVKELDHIEDKGYDEDELKGSLIFRQVVTSERCPHCSASLERFQYRLNDVHLDFCPQEHGYWLDAGEDARIIELMNQREAAMERKVAAEKEWSDTLDRMRSQSLVTKMEKHLRRRAFFYKLRRILPFQASGSR